MRSVRGGKVVAWDVGAGSEGRMSAAGWTISIIAILIVFAIAVRWERSKRPR